MFNMFFNESNIELIDIGKTLSNFNGLIIGVIVIIFAISVIGMIIKGVNIAQIIMSVGLVALVVFLLMNPDKFSLLGEKIFNIMISLLETVKSVKNTTNNQI